MIGAIEPMQVDMPEENENDAGAEEHEEQNYIVENPSLDLESHSNAYTGLAKLYRLQFIAEHCPVYSIEALKLAIRSGVSQSDLMFHFIFYFQPLSEHLQHHALPETSS